MRLLAGEAWNNLWNLVFTNELGGHLCHCTVYKKFKAIVRELGMPEERFHDLRHSFAVASIESGDDIKTVRSDLGHATASFTLDVYGHVSQKCGSNPLTAWRNLFRRCLDNGGAGMLLKSRKGSNKGSKGMTKPCNR